MRKQSPEIVGDRLMLAPSAADEAFLTDEESAATVSPKALLIAVR